MAQRIAGVAYVKVDGTQYPLRGNFTVSPSNVERQMLAGQDGVHGYSEIPRVPSGASGRRARTKWMTFSVMSWSPQVMKIFWPVMR